MPGGERPRIDLDEWFRNLPQPPIQFSPTGPSAEYLAREDIIRETNELFTMHLRGELEQLGLRLPDNIPTHIRPTNHFETLRNLANDFQHSPQRMWVHEQAQNVDLNTLNFRTFQELLNGLFQEGGVTHERILVLFYFCTDLSVRALQDAMNECFIRLYSWTLCFFSSKLAFWIQQQGGWGNILHNSVSYIMHFSVIGFCIAGIIAACVYIRSRR